MERRKRPLRCRALDHPPDPRSAGPLAELTEPLGSDEVLILLVGLDEVLDERTRRSHRQPALPYVVKCLRRQPTAEPMALVLRSHLGVHELDTPGMYPIRRETGDRTIDPRFVSPSLCVVHDVDVLFRRTHVRSPSLRCGTTSSASSCSVDRPTRSCRKNTKNVTPMPMASRSRRTTVSGVPTCSVACRPQAPAPNRRSASAVTSGTARSVGASASTDSVDSRIVAGSRPTRAHVSCRSAIFVSSSLREYVGQFHQSAYFATSSSVRAPPPPTMTGGRAAGAGLLGTSAIA